MKFMTKLMGTMLFAGLCFLASTPNVHAVSLWACDWGGNLYSVDASNASLGYIGNTGLSGLGALEFAPNGILYGFTAGTGNLYKIDPNNASTTLVGLLSPDFYFEGGLAFSPTGAAYGVNQGDNGAPYLFSIDLNTRSATNIGQMGTGHDINGIAWRSDGMLVGIDDNTNSLVTIDPNTAALAHLADLGFTAGSIGGMTFSDIPDFGYFATGTTGTNGLYSFDMFNGGNAFIGNFAALDPNGVSGLAASPVPEPATLGLMGLGLVGLALRRRKKSKA